MRQLWEKPQRQYYIGEWHYRLTEQIVPINLRHTLAGSLLKKDGASFIQNDGSKHYRISTHPDWITHDKQRLLDHPDLRLKALSRELF